MPSASLRPCAHPGCRELVSRGRCPAHTRKDADDHGGKKTAERGYDGHWRRFRDWFIRRHPICADCQRKPTKDVHHVRKLRDYPELRCVESNCLGLCHGCHAIRSARGE